jgi:Holliday junction resolvasome RuvABC endonuclease subunit
LDPGFASLGYATLVLEERARVVEFGVMHTEKSAKKKQLLEVDDGLRRAMELAAWLRRIVASGRTVAICAESLSISVGWSNGVAAKMGMVWGVIASLAEATGIPVLQGSPQDVKKAVCRVKTATKGEVQEAVLRLYPEIEPLRAHIPRGAWEHCHDAVAAGHLALSSNVVRMARLAA